MMQISSEGEEGGGRRREAGSVCQSLISPVNVKGGILMTRKIPIYWINHFIGFKLDMFWI